MNDMHIEVNGSVDKIQTPLIMRWNDVIEFLICTNDRFTLFGWSMLEIGIACESVY